jgi:hypothetical protein
MRGTTAILFGSRTTYNLRFTSLKRAASKYEVTCTHLICSLAADQDTPAARIAPDLQYSLIDLPVELSMMHGPGSNGRDSWIPDPDARKRT